MQDSALGARLGDAPLGVNLDDGPLPDEPFEWAGIADAVRPTVTEVLDWCDRCANELLDVEHRAAMRRFLSRAAAADPGAFRRKRVRGAVDAPKRGHCSEVCELDPDPPRPEPVGMDGVVAHPVAEARNHFVLVGDTGFDPVTSSV